MGAIRAVLFDFGDTLFERQGGYRALLRAAQELGATVNEDEARSLWDAIQLRARTPEELARGRDLSADAHRACWTDLYRPADIVGPGMAELLYSYEVGALHWQPFPEVPEVLARLRDADVRVGVVSDTGFDIREVFSAHGLLDAIDVFVLSCEHGVVKPAATLFAHACATLGVAPGETLMVGDNPLTDGGAVGAGLPVFVVPSPALRPPRVLDAVVLMADDGGPTGGTA